MDDLIAWLRAQLDDDERVAREAGDDAMTWHPGAEAVYDDLRTLAVAPFGGTLHEAQHIARWDPARVLAEVDAKRRILDMVQGWMDAGYPTMDQALRLLALPYAQHEGYRDEWRPTTT
jgi:hypothetical protein